MFQNTLTVKNMYAALKYTCSSHMQNYLYMCCALTATVKPSYSIRKYYNILFSNL